MVSILKDVGVGNSKQHGGANFCFVFLKSQTEDPTRNRTIDSNIQVELGFCLANPIFIGSSCGWLRSQPDSPNFTPNYGFGGYSG